MRGHHMYLTCSNFIIMILWYYSIVTFFIKQKEREIIAISTEQSILRTSWSVSYILNSPPVMISERTLT